jgi:hypothetical protein
MRTITVLWEGEATAAHHTRRTTLHDGRRRAEAAGSASAVRRAAIRPAAARTSLSIRPTSDTTASARSRTNASDHEHGPGSVHDRTGKSTGPTA